MMKKLYTIVCLLMSMMPLMAQTTFPNVSNGSTEYWYYIQMQNGMGVLTVQGENQNIVTAEAVEKKASSQQWKIVASTGNRYQFISRGGQVMYYAGDKFKTSASPTNGYSINGAEQDSEGNWDAGRKVTQIIHWHLLQLKTWHLRTLCLMLSTR